MKVTHVCLCGVYTPNFNYQENLLAKYHKKIGYDVEIIASRYCYDKGKVIEDTVNEFVNEDNILVKRLDWKYHNKICRKLGIYKNLYEVLNISSPDILFIHGVQYLDILTIKKFLKNNRDIITYIDNHADYSNSATNIISKYLLHKMIWRYCAKKINQYVKRWYGVLPARCDFLNELYKIPKNKIELLVMGGDDDKILNSMDKNYIKKLKTKYGIKNKDLLLVTGGKIDKWKTDTLILMDAVNELDSVFLLIFGSVDKEISQTFKAKLSDKVKYIGWINSDESYKIFSSADLVVFPGRHSVYWEQVISQGKPLLVKYYKGYSHIDIGGNVEYLNTVNKYEIKKRIVDLMFTEKYYRLREAANSKKKENFYYSTIAKKSIKDDSV